METLLPPHPVTLESILKANMGDGYSENLRIMESNGRGKVHHFRRLLNTTGKARVASSEKEKMDNALELVTQRREETLLTSCRPVHLFGPGRRLIVGLGEVQVLLAAQAAWLSVQSPELLCSTFASVTIRGIYNVNDALWGCLRDNPHNA